MGAFARVCVGQMISLCGSHLTSFVLGLWVYQQTRSATKFSLIAFFAMVPEIALAPLAGALVDRCNRRWVLIGGNTGAAVCTLFLVVLALENQLAVWPIYLAVAVSSAFQAVQYPALSSSIPLWVPERQLSRANALMELGNAIAMIVAPAVAALLLRGIGFRGIFVVDALTFAVVIGTLAVSHFPVYQPSQQEHVSRPSLLKETLRGWHYIQGRRDLLALLILFALTNFAIGIVQVLLPPLVLSFSSALGLGIVMSFAGAGAVVGSLLVSILGAARRKVRTILLLALVQGSVLFLGVLRPGVPLVAGAAFVFSFCAPIIIASSQTIWQTEVEQEMQGRAFAIRKFIAWSSLPIAYLIAGPLADRVFEPLLGPAGSLADTIGALIGTGAGRGIALFFIVLGLLIAATVLAGFRYQPFWTLEQRLLSRSGRTREGESSRPVLVG